MISTIVVNDGRELAVDLEITAGPRQQGAAEPLPRPVGARDPRRAAGGAVRAGGSGAGARGSRRTPAVPRRTGHDAATADRRRASRLRQGAAAADRAAQNRGGRALPRRPQCARHPRRVGRPPRRARRATDRGAGRAGQRARPRGGEGLPIAGAGVAARGDPVPQRGRGGRDRGSSGTDSASSSRRRCSMRWRAGATPNSNAASAWSARTATISSCGSAIRSRKALPAMANRGRWRWRCGWPPTNCCGPKAAIRCCCSTMCSPNWIPRAAERWPTWRRRPSRCW